MQAREGEYVDVGLAAGDHHKMRDWEVWASRLKNEGLLAAGSAGA